MFTYRSISPSSSKKIGSLSSTPAQKRKRRKILGLILLALCFLGVVAVAIWMQLQVFKDLPDVSKVKDMQFQQATVITDRNGVELYKLFEENREYIDISEVNQHMVDAIVAIEDQRYWEHEGLDPWGIFRAAITRKGGASTIPQQLMTNVFKMKAGMGASIMERAKYKLRQIVLSKRLNTVLQKQIKAEKPGLSNDEIKREMKLKVLEMYLNYIEFGNNAFGIEAASKAYFGVSSSELSIAQSSILASLPKGPTQYSPLTEAGRKRLMGYFNITDASGKEYPFEWELQQNILVKFKDAVQQADFSNKNVSNASTKFLVGLGSFTIMADGKEYYVKYINGRKDVVLSRMFEDGYITDKDFQQAFIETLSLKFQTSAFQIKAPHFVFWIKELLEQQYGKEAITKGMIVKTTLDMEIQKKAEEAFTNNVRTLYANGANNSSMVYVDTDNGDVLVYVGSLDYFNDEIQGQNDMVRNPRQSGSSIKPLIYSLWLEKLPLTIDTPMYDLPFQVGPDKPNNADGKFEGLIPLKYALGHSRNIPAVKMYLAAGGEDTVKPYLQKLWLSGVVDETHYGYPLALGAAEVNMLELASAYSHLTTETPAEINPILEITSADGSILYKKEVVEKEEIIPSGIKYLMRKILSEPNNRLPGWITKFNVSGLTYALKTGTSNVVTERGSRPRDGWLAAYMPNKLVLMRAGNANASPMNANAFGGTIHADPIKQFLKSLLDTNYISNSEMPNIGTANVTISRVTGRLAAENAPMEMSVSSIGYISSVPSTADETVAEVEYDAQCLGIASPMTPSSDLRRGYVVQNFTSFMPSQADLADIKAYLTDSSKTAPDSTGAKVALSSLNILFEMPKEYCENRQPMISDATIINILSPQNDRKISPKPELMFSIKSDASLKTLIASVDGTPVYTKNYTKNQNEDLWNTVLDLSSFTPGEHKITVQAINSRGFTNMSEIKITLQSSDKEAPYFVKDQSKVKVEGENKDVTLIFNDHLSAVLGGTISANGNVITTFEGRLANFTTTASSVQVEVKDSYENILKETIDITSL